MSETDWEAAVLRRMEDFDPKTFDKGFKCLTHRSGKAQAAVSALLEALCSRTRARNVLEYTNTQTILSRAIIEKEDVDHVQFVAPEITVADALTLLFRDK